MAVTDLTPKIKGCFKNGCTQIEFSDITLLYNISSNTGGWGDISTITNVDIDLATIQYKHASEEEYHSVDVTLALTEETITGSFILATEDITTGDGLYTFIYTLTDGEESVSKTIYIYSLCGVRCCIDKMWYKYITEEIDCTCGCNDNLLDDIFKAESLYRSLLSTNACGNVATADKLLTKLQRICSYQDCGCS